MEWLGRWIEVAERRPPAGLVVEVETEHGGVTWATPLYGGWWDTHSGRPIDGRVLRWRESIGGARRALGTAA
jgi:hypothetical protein